MPSMTKRVNVYAQVAVRNITPPIYGTCKDIIMTTGDILKCLCKRARVEEILPDGSIVRLNLRNYYLDNGAGLDASKNNINEETIKTHEDKPTRFKVPVAPQAQVVETNKTEIKEKQVVENTTCEPENANSDIDTNTVSTDIASEKYDVVESVSVTAIDDYGDITTVEDTVDVATSGNIHVLSEDNAEYSDELETVTECASNTITAADNLNNTNTYSKKKNKKK